MKIKKPICFKKETNTTKNAKGKYIQYSVNKVDIQ
jgi:hypothetical protein